MVKVKRPKQSASSLSPQASRGKQGRRWFFWWLPILISAIAFSIGYEITRSHLTQPQAVLVLGGDRKREQFAAGLARRHPYLLVWVSSGSNREYVEWVFLQAGVNSQRLHLDYQAVDTVTNFTTVVSQLQAHRINCVYLVTSDDHMRRALVVGEIILGSRGIDIRPLAVPSGRTQEPLEKVIRDAARAMLWVTTGRTGATLGHYLPQK